MWLDETGAFPLIYCSNEFHSNWHTRVGLWALGGSYAQVTARGEIWDWIDWLSKASYQRGPYCVCAYVYLYVHFPLMDFHANQSERGTGQGHWCCLCLDECSVFPSVLICVGSCIYMYICFTHVLAWLLVENTCSALLLVRPWGTELHQPHLQWADTAPNIII